MSRAISAKVTNPNTPESDKPERVLHTVVYEDGTSELILATDPLNALDIANERQV